MVSLAYQFIFEKDANLWNNIYQFEGDLANFFKNNGLEAKVVETVEGSGGNKVIIIGKLPYEPEKLQNPKGPQLSANPSIGRLRKSSSIVNRLTSTMQKGMK